MKKIGLTLTVIALAGSLSFAQSGLHLGVKFIPQKTYLLNQDDSDASSVDYKATTGLAYGFSGSFHFAETTGIGVDFLFSSQGQKYKTGGNETEVKLNYIKIPLALKFTSDPEGMVMFAGEIGPQIGLLQKATYTTSAGGGKTDVKDQYSSTDFSAMIAMGLAFNITEFFQLTVQARLDYGFTDAEDKDHPSYASDRAITNNITGGVAIGAYYILGM